MAEGSEETDSNSNADVPAMLGTVMPCEALTASLCGNVKKEYDTNSNSSCGNTNIRQVSPVIPQSTVTNSNGISSAPASAITETRGNSIASSPGCPGSTGSPSRPASSTSPNLANVQSHPINLKSEESDKDVVEKTICESNSSPPPHNLSAISANSHENESNLHSDFFNSFSTSAGRIESPEHSKIFPITNHLNGTMQDMINLQKLQNLATMRQAQQHSEEQQHQEEHQQQQQKQHQQQHPSIPAALASLQGLSGISTAAVLNSPLNLSIASASGLPSPNNCIKPAILSPSSNTLGGNNDGMAGCNLPGGSQMPQLILASGQLVQGVQGAQLLIPTSQGVAVQTILTIPVSQQINTNEQFLQSYAALNTGAAAAAAAAATFGPHRLGLPSTSLVKPNFFSPGVQQLLAALHPDLFTIPPAPPPHLQTDTLHAVALHCQQSQDAAAKAHLFQQLQKQQSPQSTQNSLHYQQQTAQQQSQHQHQKHFINSRTNNDDRIENLSPKIELKGGIVPPSSSSSSSSSSSLNSLHRDTSSPAGFNSHAHNMRSSSSPLLSSLNHTSLLNNSSRQQQQLSNQNHTNSSSFSNYSSSKHRDRDQISPSRSDRSDLREKEDDIGNGTNSIGGGSIKGLNLISSSSANLQNKLNSTSTSISECNSFNTSSSSTIGSQLFRSGNHHLSPSPSSSSQNKIHGNSSTASHNLNNDRGNSPSSSASVLNSINRLTATNGELTITKSHSTSNNSSVNEKSLSSSPSPGPTMSHHHHQHHSGQSVKLSPTSMQISPTGTDNTADLLIDSPNEPTINQTNCNVVDGIDLDEIKEFAKAFKLRRLSLGLTQTQVGQALSVTEGPAYSQSAICSALAAQMYAAQLSSQQQNMFEKLDITPKSAQKIKPVLERWMKEAEESHWNRYKAGQNHLTDFIGVEPSKKRKRRTSFTPQALELLNAHFERNTHPSGTEITGLAHQLGYEREVIRIWFCNKRQALKNTVRMMSKGMV